ncbi:carbohydrate binding domain-containing protein [Streptomyces sp. NPDC088194]|uniref:carbohydrate binding domain-containing protein n=1 Tax=Streptomyces sp. NPDC088194 TaxID=3154931 RepID=UPI00344B60C2
MSARAAAAILGALTVALATPLVLASQASAATVPTTPHPPAAALPVGSSHAGAALRPVIAPTRRSYYVDCAATTDGNGTLSRPWNSLTDANAHTYHAGEALRLMRGTTCTGTLSPKGSGSAAAPFTISDYGTSSARAVVDGDGAPNAVYLYNEQFIQLTNLEITDQAAPGTNRRGVEVVAQDIGAARNYLLSHLYVHDIRGDTTKGTDGSAGIDFEVHGTTTPTWFDGVVIQDDTVDDVDRSGITEWSTWGNDAAVNDPTDMPEPRHPTRGLVIQGNTLHRIGGDGIVVIDADNSLVQYNTLAGFHLEPTGYDAGIWPWDADGTVFQYNDVSGGAGTNDGMAFDVDQGTAGTVYQYNYSHDNDGGFMLFCNADGSTSDAVVRYNISQDDSYRGFENCSGAVSGMQVYNNTLYIGPGVSQTVVNENNTTPREVSFSNNIVVKSGSGSASFNLRSGGYTFHHNDFVNLGGLPSDPGGTTADPAFCDPGDAGGIRGATGYRLCAGSPVAGIGAAVRGNGGRDYFGVAVSPTAAPNIGASAAAPSAGAPNLLPDGGLEAGNLNGWSTRGATAAQDPAAHGGAYDLSLNAPSGGAATAEYTVTGLQPNTAYRYTGWVRTTGAPTWLGVKNHGGAQVSASTTATGWTRLSAPFTTGAGDTSATVFCYLPSAGRSSCDDLSVTAGG